MPLLLLADASVTGINVSERLLSFPILSATKSASTKVPSASNVISMCAFCVEWAIGNKPCRWYSSACAIFS